MAVSYADIESALLAQARKDAAAYAATRRQLATQQKNAYADEIKKEFDAQQKSLSDRVFASQDEEVAVRNAASVKQALTRRQVKARLAGQGLSDSGLEKAALAGVDAAKRQTAQESKAREQAVIKQVHASINEAYAAMQKKWQEKSRALTEAAEKDILSNQTSLEKAARTRAGQIARSSKALALWEAGGY